MTKKLLYGLSHIVERTSFVFLLNRHHQPDQIFMFLQSVNAIRVYFVERRS